jgi:bidirectional [NiFe] hydrogenase diaphorase subunit
MSVITLTINEELVSGRDGQTLLEVIQEHEIYIPTLCHMSGLSDRGGCRLCMVDIQGRLVAACVTEAVEGMVVQTDTPQLRAYRRIILELVFAERNHICAVCVVNGHCELQALAAKLGMDHVRYDYLVRDLPMDASHDRFVVDHNRCILCTRCVRVCDQVEGAHTWDLSGRGVNTCVTIDLGKPWGESLSCTSCGKCVQICPTGALYTKGMSVAEMQKRHGFLSWILSGRQDKEWSW